MVSRVNIDDRATAPLGSSQAREAVTPQPDTRPAQACDEPSGIRLSRLPENRHPAYGTRISHGQAFGSATTGVHGSNSVRRWVMRTCRFSSFAPHTGLKCTRP